MELLTTPGDDRWLAAPVESGRSAGFGVYLHVPFCHHRCGYCDFATEAVGTVAVTERDALFRRYTAALITDLGRQVAAGTPNGRASGGMAGERDWPTVTSVFVGGGTPTLLPPHLLGAIVSAVADEFDVAAEAEITVECNPETASPELFATLRDAGVTRVSMGAQSFVPAVLDTLERGHTAERPLEAVEQARAGGIDQVSLDLIFGTPGETDDDWRRSLEGAVDAGVDHLSAYALTIHVNTPFGRAVSSGTMQAPDGDVQRDRFELAREVLGRHGADHYEVSNWALGPDCRSRHNLLYWRHGDYLGVGVGAHGHLGTRRWWTTRSTSHYLHAVEGSETPIAGSEELAVEDLAHERLLLGLRVREGIHVDDLPPLDPTALAGALDDGLITEDEGRLRCTSQGWFLLDEAVTRLI